MVLKQRETVKEQPIKTVGELKKWLEPLKDTQEVCVDIDLIPPNKAVEHGQACDCITECYGHNGECEWCVVCSDYTPAG